MGYCTIFRQIPIFIRNVALVFKGYDRMFPVVTGNVLLVFFPVVRANCFVGSKIFLYVGVWLLRNFRLFLYVPHVVMAFCRPIVGACRRAVEEGYCTRNFFRVFRALLFPEDTYQDFYRVVRRVRVRQVFLVDFFRVVMYAMGPIVPVVKCAWVMGDRGAAVARFFW